MNENSGPVRNSSTTTLPRPNLSSRSMSLNAASASDNVRATTTPFPAANPSYFSTAGSGRDPT